MFATKEKRVVDDRVLLLGLDYLYREAIKQHERSELLDCARDLSARLKVNPGSGPVEGYYKEDAELTEYFQLMRALQDVGDSFRPAVASAPSYQRLRAVTSSRVYGDPTDNRKLLPPGRDALSKALWSEPPAAWSITHLAQVAHESSVRDDEISLVGLAARAKDSVVLAALRESVVLYAEIVVGSALRPPKPKYVWEVDSALAHQAARFVATFNDLFDEALPDPSPKNAATFWYAAGENEILGRCVRMGLDDSSPVVRHYHWGICLGGAGEARVVDFWDPELWTTERFRQSLRPGRHCVPPSR